MRSSNAKFLTIQNEITCVNSITDQPRYYCSYRDLLLLRRSMVMELISSLAAFRFKTFVGRLRSTRSNSHAATLTPEAFGPESCPLSLTSARSWYVLRSTNRKLIDFIRIWYLIKTCEKIQISFLTQICVFEIYCLYTGKLNSL